MGCGPEASLFLVPSVWSFGSPACPGSEPSSCKLPSGRIHRNQGLQLCLATRGRPHSTHWDSRPSWSRTAPLPVTPELGVGVHRALDQGACSLERCRPSSQDLRWLTLPFLTERLEGGSSSSRGGAEALNPKTAPEENLLQG